MTVCSHTHSLGLVGSGRPWEYFGAELSANSRSYSYSPGPGKSSGAGVGIEDYSLHACWKMGYIILTVLWVEQYVRICWSAPLTTAVVRGLGQV